MNRLDDRAVVEDTLSAGNALDAVAMHSRNVTGFDAQYRTSIDFKQRFEIWESLIKDYSKASGRVIDVGCGTGVFSFLAAKYNQSVFGIDGSAEMVECCRKKQSEYGQLDTSFAQCRIKDIPRLVNHRADLVLCSSVLEYVGELDEAVRVLGSLLHPEGTLIVSMPNRKSLYRGFERVTFRLIGRPKYFAYVKHLLAIEELDSIASRYHLQKVRFGYYGNLHPFLSRLLRSANSPRANSLFVAVYQRT